MAMKKCKECGEEISSSAKVCPKCGKKQGGIGKVILILFVLIVIIAAAGSGTSSNKGTTGETKVQETFTLTEHKGYADTYAYYIEGTIVNNTDKEYSYVQVEFNLYDADGAQIGTSLDNINNLEANGTWKFKAIGAFADEKSVASYKLIDITGF